MKKILSVIICAMIVLSAFAGCAADNVNPSETTSGTEVTVTNDVTESTPAQTTLEDILTTAPTTTEPIQLVALSSKTVKESELGMPILEAISDNPYTVGSKALSLGGVKLTAYADGEAKITVVDHFGHKASIDATVKDGQISYTAHPTTEKFIEVKSYGAKGDGTTDDTAAFQKAVDSAKPGETVYVYPGVYKVTLLTMREGVTLEMYTTMTDAHEGYSNRIARDITLGKVTVLIGTRIMNGEDKQPGRECAKSFTVRGGVIDNQQTGRGPIVFACADGALLENVIIKNMKNNHAIQYTGSINSTIRNCMFAGYTWGGTFTRETIQIEPSTPGATGAVPNSPISFEEGEYNSPENITIEHCYFGKSDTCGAPLIAIGHHSNVGINPNVSNFRIIDNIFDEVMYAAIRYANISDCEISGNKFISTSAYMNVSDPSATTPAFIVFYPINSARTYANIVNGKTVTNATTTEQSGIHNVKIVNNSFNLSEGSDKMIIYAGGTEYVPGLIYSSSALLRQTSYDAEPYNFMGYTVCQNYMENFLFANNEINITGQPKYTNMFMYFYRILGLTIKDNTINIADGIKFSLKSTDGQVGLIKRACTEGQAPDKYRVTTGLGRYFTLENGDGSSIKMTATGTHNVIITIEGEGKLISSVNKSGSGSLTPEGLDGYRFAGWYTQSGQAISEKLIEVGGTLQLVAKFVK